MKPTVSLSIYFLIKVLMLVSIFSLFVIVPFGEALQTGYGLCSNHGMWDKGKKKKKKVMFMI